MVPSTINNYCNIDREDRGGGGGGGIGCTHGWRSSTKLSLKNGPFLCSMRGLHANALYCYVAFASVRLAYPFS